MGEHNKMYLCCFSIRELIPALTSLKLICTYFVQEFFLTVKDILRKMPSTEAGVFSKWFKEEQNLNDK